MKKIGIKSFITILLSVFVINIIVFSACVFLFCGKYVGTSDKILKYDDLFFDFSEMDNMEYYYNNFSSDANSYSFEDVKPIFKSSEYKVLPKYKAKLMVMAQNKSNSCGQIMVVRDSYDNEDGLAYEIVDYDESTFDSYIYSARIFKYREKYYIYCFPKTQNIYSDFIVCEIVNSTEFENSEIINAHADNFIYPYSYITNVIYTVQDRYIKVAIIAAIILESVIVYVFYDRKKRHTKKISS